MKKNTIILIAIIALSICTITVVAVNAATSKPHTNTFNYIYDESVYIPEPEEKAANIPDYVRWGPMLGLYVRRDHIYNPETHSFEKVVDTKIDTTSPTYRQEEWLKVNEGSDNKLYLAIIKWYRRDPSTNEMSLSFSGLWNPELDTVFQKEMLKMAKILKNTDFLELFIQAPLTLAKIIVIWTEKYCGI